MYYYIWIVCAKKRLMRWLVASRVSRRERRLLTVGVWPHSARAAGQQHAEHQAAVEAGAHGQAQRGEAVHQRRGPKCKQVQASVAVRSFVHHAGHLESLQNLRLAAPVAKRHRFRQIGWREVAVCVPCVVGEWEGEVWGPRVWVRWAVDAVVQAFGFAGGFSVAGLVDDINVVTAWRGEKATWSQWLWIKCSQVWSQREVTKCSVTSLN